MEIKKKLNASILRVWFLLILVNKKIMYNFGWSERIYKLIKKLSYLIHVVVRDTEQQ